MLNYFHVSNYRQWKLDLRAQIELLRASADRFSESEREKADSEISDEVEAGLISLVDKSTTIIYTILGRLLRSVGKSLKKSRFSQSCELFWSVRSRH